MEVGRNVRAIQEHGMRSMKTMVNLGSDVYVHAKVYVLLKQAARAALTLWQA